LVAKSVLDSLIYLHNNGVFHGNLFDTTVIMDNSGNIRVTDYCLIPFIQELIYGEQYSPDLSALGALIESLMPTPTLEMRDFINLCKSERTLSGSELLDHSFLFPTISEHNFSSPENGKSISNIPHVSERPQLITQVPLPPIISSDYSRLHVEFDVINFIGKGAYGDVLKVRNKLDNRQYALKRIPLYANTKQLYKKMTREVELLSRLNHENVVRYFNSWMEIQTTTNECNELEELSDISSSNNKPQMVKTKSSNRLPIPATNVDDSSSDDDDSFQNWNYFNANDSSSDGIEFVDSNGKVAEYVDENSDSGKLSGGGDLIRKNTILYIQMEFCEKSTLRTAIDGNLYQNRERVMKMFREIIEGLAHIHQQGMIHRDLKPVNIFLDSKDHVKIGDFGLATTSVLALQHQNHQVDIQKSNTAPNYGESHTGQVGTALYVAPELEGNASKSTYNQKVDLYSLGIIFFEMINPPFETAMERIMTIKAIRASDIKIPNNLLQREEMKKEIELLKWLLNHNPAKRPTSEELLQSDLIPPLKLDSGEFQEMLRHILASPNSRSYKHLIARCFTQEWDKNMFQLYNCQTVITISSLYENVKHNVIEILRKHGGIDVSGPLLTPYSKSIPVDDAVKLMCNSGSIVNLPYDLHQHFLRHVAINGITSLRRYSVGRIYREQCQNAHPQQSFELAFDIVTPNRGNLLVDAELIAVAHEIVNQFELNNVSFRINHLSLLRAIFMFYSIPKDKHRQILHIIGDYTRGKMKKMLAKEALRNLLPSKEQVVDIFLMTDLTQQSISSSLLRTLIKGKGEASALAKGAIRELETVMNLCKNLGVTSPLNLCIGLSSNYDGLRPGSIIWQMGYESKPGKFSRVAGGERYDNALEDHRKSAVQSGLTVVNREMYCAGFSLSFEKLMTLIMKQCESPAVYRAVVDLVVYVVGFRPPMKEITHLLRSLWTNGIQCCYLEVPSMKDDEDYYARELGANHILVLGEDGYLKVKSWQVDRYSERNVTRLEILEYLKKNLNADVAQITENYQNIALQRNNSVTSMSNKNYEAPVGMPTLDIIFVMMEKLNSNKRKRLENQIEQKLGNVLMKFNKKETFAIFAIELDMNQIRMMVSCIDPNPKDQKTADLDCLLER
jgi:eukaryotic translation initiation factor 2-alpha kinase 4